MKGENISVLMVRAGQCEWLDLRAVGSAVMLRSPSDEGVFVSGLLFTSNSGLGLEEYGCEDAEIAITFTWVWWGWLSKAGQVRPEPACPGLLHSPPTATRTQPAASNIASL